MDVKQMTEKLPALHMRIDNLSDKDMEIPQPPEGITRRAHEFLDRLFAFACQFPEWRQPMITADWHGNITFEIWGKNDRKLSIDFTDEEGERDEIRRIYKDENGRLQMPQFSTDKEDTETSWLWLIGYKRITL